MHSQIKQIADRVKELREILELTPQEVAEGAGILVEDYLCYENATKDIPIGTLHGIAGVMNVDATVLLIGEMPRMTSHTVSRKNKGIEVERYPGYKFNSLAYNYVRREMEPLLVFIEPDDQPAHLVTHSGQEFNFVLAGQVILIHGKNEFTLNEGDSIYFDPRIPHGQRAGAKGTKFLTVINEQSTSFSNVKAKEGL